MKYDFSGWATKSNIKCADGLTIMRGAFADNDGKKVPLVWNHDHDDPTNVLGHAILENRDDGVYAYCSFNETAKGQNAKLFVEHGDVDSLSIYANHLKKNGNAVVHGQIKEVSLVLAGANPGAFIDAVMSHGEESDDEVIIYSGEDLCLYHADDDILPEESIEHSETNNKEEESPMEKVEEKAKTTPVKEGEKTVKDVFDTLTEEQKTVVYALIVQALEEKESAAQSDEYEGGNNTMKHNLFDIDDIDDGEVICHADIEATFNDVKRYGSLKDSALAHGIEHIDYLFPDATNLNKEPGLITRDMGWVQNVMSNVHHTPFSRIKSVFADITADDARAKGYVKGNLKLEEVFTLLKRTTTPTTIYKKQKLDRDDVIDITDFDTVAFLKSEMRLMLDEEIARAILVGDGRLSSSDDKINEGNIRPIWTDADLYTIKKTIALAANVTDDNRAKAIIRAAVKARKDYKGSGNPTWYTTEDYLTDCLLLEDTTGRRIYKDASELASAIRVKSIVTAPILENLTRTDNGTTYTLAGIIVNLADYNVGADKGGAVNMFDDFDIDYNAMKYLIETRCSGALVKPYSAIALELTTSAS